MNAEGHTAPIDPYLDVPLEGLQLIEASAGTGKTYTLATLVTRLVIERSLRVSHILAVTFTEAATQELRERLRQRFALAARVAEHIAAGPSIPGDSSGAGGAEAELTRTLIQRQLQHEDAASLRARLQRAAHEIDLAAVFTIHGFCARVLGEHALETGQAFVRPEMIGSDRELRDEVAHDLWRACGADPASAELLQAQWSGPDQLADDLGGLLRAPQLLPALPEASPDPLPAVHGALETLREEFVRHGEEARTALDAAIAGKVIDGRKARAASYDKAWAALAAGLASGRLARTDDHLDKLTPARLRECAKAGAEHRLPTSPLFDALADWFAADDARARWLEQCGLILVHRVRDQAAVRLARLKRVRRVQTFDDLIDGVAAALEGPHGDALAGQLRARYAVALVDEFQDTDARQWTIFERVFGAGNLFLIGDPKQAIYRFRGGDVHTYLAAADQAIRAPALGRNFRSRPALLRAVGVLYRHAGEAAFVDPRIRFQAMQPGGRSSDANFQRDGRVAPALTVRLLPPPDDGRKQPQWNAPESRELATRACVAEIHALLGEARAGRASIGPRPVQAGDIAVLVRSHDEAARMQAVELLTVFEALLQPGDEGRLRAALATVLLGLDAEAVARLDEDPGWQQTWQSRALGWRERWQRHGPLALVADMCAQHAPRLLGLVDGERRLSNLLQIGEALQDADARALGLHGLVDWLRTRIRDADPNDEQQQLRLESDARRVQIVTLHKSKGLEYPLVFLPFAGIGKEPRSRRWCEVPGDIGRVLHLRPDDEAVAAWRREERAEDARLLYVGLTRAQQALWLASGPLYKAADTPLAAMLADLQALSADNAGAVVIDDSGAPPTRLTALPPQHAAGLPEARRPQRVLSRDWWVYSFTQLARAGRGEAEAAAPEPATPVVTLERGADDEPDTPAADGIAADGSGAQGSTAVATPGGARFSGSRFGNVLHEALEHVDFAAWRDWRDDAPPPGQAAPLRDALRAAGYAEGELDDGVMQLAGLIGSTLTVALPEGARLCAVPLQARRAEMEFHFALQPTDVEALLATLHAHGVVPQRHAFGARHRLEGLMTGKIDLVYEHAGRYYVLDYKSNRLPGYDAATLERAMADSEYTLQALIYTLALHRWLRFRRGAEYDYARDFGGVRYLFCRGLDAQARPSPGIHAHTPAPALVDALDALFGAHGGRA